MDFFECGCDYGNRRESCSNSGCREREALPDCVRVAMAYVPYQQWNEIYAADKGFSAGTMFPCLNLPFEGCSR